MAIVFVGLNDNPGPSYSFDGAAFHLINGTQGWPVDNGGRTGLFKSGATYVQFVYDSAATKIRCYTSPDLAVWTEQDAAHAPVYSQSATAGAWPQDINLAVCQSSANPTVFYVLYFSGGGTLTTQVLTLQPFTVGTGWGTIQASTLNLQSIGGGATTSAIDGVVVYRPSDDSVFYITGVNFDIVGGSVKTGYYAQCKPNGSGWVNIWVQLGVLPTPGAPNPPGVNSIGACLDTQGSVCVIQKAQTNPVVAQQFHLFFQRIHADNSQSVVTEFESANLPTNSYLSGVYCSPAGKVYVALMGNTISSIYAAFTSDAPTFSKTPLPTLQGGFPSWTDFFQTTLGVTEITLEADGQTVSTSTDPFSSALSLAVAPVALFSIFGLVAPGMAAPRTGGQLAFYGVRRRKGFKNDPQPSNYAFGWRPKPYTIEVPFTLPIGMSKLTGGMLVSQQVTDYDFVLERIDGYGGSPAGYAGLDPGNYKILLLDMNKIQISNIPLLFSNLLHVPDNAAILNSQVSANSIPKNFWPTPPMMYRVNSSIQFFIYVTSLTPLAAAVNFEFSFHGYRRYPCFPEPGVR